MAYYNRVVGETRNQTLRELRRNTAYLTNGEFGPASLAYLVRTRTGLADPMMSLRARIAAVDRRVAVSRVVTLTSVIARFIWQEKLLSTTFGFFGEINAGPGCPMKSM